ncbi:adenylate kinase [Seminavis robusta]|uniref:Adenylate kinase n=1 Tax=Seminavis robusta TaxID=568900 RepID=A0A9N8E6H9_9STRA|nr:adenylate kinase [Seminavis robusta]|eukprot:Sro673_g185160.1 adenylate kinase (1482) ;mRNA; r:5026-9643
MSASSAAANEDNTDSKLLAQEALLRRIASTSEARRVLALKGSFLTRTWALELGIDRPAADLDFAALYPVDGDDCIQTRGFWQDCCSSLQQEEDDGCSVVLRSTERTRKDYPVPHSNGLFSVFDVTLPDETKVELHVDIGWGDPIFPTWEWMKYACQNGTNIQFLAVPMEMQFGWKCAALFKRNKWTVNNNKLQTTEANSDIHQQKQLVQCHWAPKDLWDLVIMIRTGRLRQGVVVTCLNVAFYALASPDLPLDARWMQRLTEEAMGSSRRSAKLWIKYRSTQSTTTQTKMPLQVHQAVQEVATYCRPLLQHLPQIAADRQFESFQQVFGHTENGGETEQHLQEDMTQWILHDICSVWTNRRQAHAYLVFQEGATKPPELRNGARVRIGYHPVVFRIVSLRPAKGWHPGTESWPPYTKDAYRLVLDPPPDFAVCGGRVILLVPNDKEENQPLSPSDTQRDAVNASPTEKPTTTTDSANTEAVSHPQPVSSKIDKNRNLDLLPTAANVEKEQFQAKAFMKKAKKCTPTPLAPPIRKGQRIVFVISSSIQKVNEFRLFFARYGIGVAHVNPYGFRTAGKTIEKVATTLEPLARQLLAQTEPNTFWCKAVMWEQMLLLKYGEDKAANFNDNPVDGERAMVKANLICWTWKEDIATAAQEFSSIGLRHAGSARDGEISTDGNTEGGVMTTKFYSNDVEGFIDLSKRGNKEQVFGFDDIFVLKATSLSYHEKKLAGFKCSPRDSNLSAFVADHVHYKNRKEWGHLPNVNQHEKNVDRKRTISIGFSDGLDCAKFVANTSYFHTGVASRLLPCFYSVVNDGVFFRSSISRREVNYWLPGLNSGIPFVKKKDEIHELTFLAHDFGHFMIPDLVFTEALRRSGVQYDFAKRAIWPLFQATGIDPFPELPDTEYTLRQFRRLLHANAIYCLLGDDSGWMELLRGNSNDTAEPEALKRFKDKYMPFFVEDYRWTSQNYDSMVSRCDEFQRWSKLVEPIKQALAGSPGGSRIETVEEFAAAIGAESSLSGRDLVERSLDRLFEDRIKPAFHGQPCAASPGVIRRNSLGRYMIGQLHLLARFPMIPDVKIYADKLCKVMTRLSGQNAVSVAECFAIRGLYDQLVVVLEEKGLITADDATTYKEVCPLFEPCYVNYDRGFGFYDQLEEVQKRILATEDPAPAVTPVYTPVVSTADPNNNSSRRERSPATLEHQGAAFIDMDRAWKSILEVPLKARLRALMQQVGVTFWDGPEGWFVRQPMAAVCAIGGLPTSLDSNDSITFGGASHQLDDIIQEWRRGMGLASMPCYMNPGKKEPIDMWNVLCKHGHFSVAHTVSLSFFLAGFSCGVENELNSQRDLVHMARVTVARTAAQQQPPIVVQHPSLLRLVEQLKQVTSQSLAVPDDISSKDWHEAANLLWPAAKAQCAVITGTLRSFQKLMAAIDDEGKEAEFRSLLLLMNATLQVLQPEMFRPNESYKYELPQHYDTQRKRSSNGDA